MGCDTSCERSWLFEGCWGCGCCTGWEAKELCLGSSKEGALAAGAGLCDCSSAVPNEIMSTMLETSFLIFSGRLVGTSFPVNFRLQRYMAKANSGKRSWPDFVVSERVLDHLVSPTSISCSQVPTISAIARRPEASIVIVDLAPCLRRWPGHFQSPT